MPPDPVRRLGALAVMVAEDAERLWQKLRLTNVEHERLASMAEGWRRMSPDFGEPGARALLYRLGPRAVHRSRAAGLGALAGDRARRGLARAGDLARALDRAGVSAEGGGLHQARRREGPGARRRAGAPPRRPGSRRGFRPTKPRSAPLPTRRRNRRPRRFAWTSCPALPTSRCCSSRWSRASRCSPPSSAACRATAPAR